MMIHEELLNKIEAIDYWQEHFANKTFMKALLAVVELHKPFIYEGRFATYKRCGGCSSLEEETLGNIYPCPTIQVIEKELQ